ncbi:Wadjet anti-phage system protein JetA family protein [Petrocella sp. FN5]|uniref:Wadjet anti-phage system protein JetA family protein n=1 Tax=Petrocella sp. FN5 TaxID=3032002 RepID=UPI0023DB6E43|nr:Wadjet anti-phage system protein JetA family protein [Petrocella sp. FN5]MDF1617613.1 DUF5716 family protein [Petrocella sp. FN5]
MELLKQVPSNFFGILASPNKEIYMQALMSIHEAFQTDWSIRRSDLVILMLDQLDDLFEGYRIEEEDANDLIEKTSSAYGNLIIRKLRDAGWLEIEMGSDDFMEYISVPDYAFKIIKVLHDILCESRDSEYNRYVYSTYSVLKTSNESGEDYKTAIDSAFEQTMELFNKLKMLHVNIRRYHKQLADHHELNQILIEHFDDFKANLADKIYYPIKTFDSVHRFKTPILAILKEWLHDDDILDLVAQEAWVRERQRRSGSETIVKDEAKEEAKRKLVGVIDTYENMDVLLKDIDKKNSDYTKATLDRMDFLLNTDRSVKGKIREIIKVITKDETNKWVHRVQSAVAISSQTIVDDNSLYVSRKVKKRDNIKKEKIRQIMDKKSVKQEADDFRSSVQEAFSKRKIQQYVFELMADKPSISAKDFPLNEDKDYVMSLLSVLESDDKESKYDVRFKEGELACKHYRIPDFDMNKKRGNHDR